MTLIDRLSKMDGPSPEVDDLIWETLEPKEYAYAHATAKEGGYEDLLCGPAYTASVDAAIALAERVLPGWGFFLRSDKDGHNCGMVYPVHNFVTPGSASGATAAISMCIAILRTKGANNA